MHDGILYRFLSSHSASTPWNDAEVEAITMTAPDAAFDLTNDGQLRIISSDGS